MRLATVAIVALLAGGAATPPSPTAWVTDPSGFLSPTTRDALDARLEGYQRATGHQIVVWIGRTLDGAPLDDWAVRTFAAWKIGRKGLDDGLVMFVLADDRAIDIEVGYGLEDEVPDAVASRIIRDVMAPPLRAGDRDGAVTAGVDAVLSAIEGGPWTGPAADRGAPPGAGFSTTQLIVGGIALVAFLILLVTRPGLAMMMLWTIAGSGRGGRHGGGGFGGFAGGGGRSGGGGARGGW